MIFKKAGIGFPAQRDVAFNAFHSGFLEFLFPARYFLILRATYHTEQPLPLHSIHFRVPLAVIDIN